MLSRKPDVIVRILACIPLLLGPPVLALIAATYLLCFSRQDDATRSSLKLSIALAIANLVVSAKLLSLLAWNVLELIEGMFARFRDFGLSETPTDATPFDI